MKDAIITLRVERELVDLAREMNFNVSEICRDALAEAVKERLNDINEARALMGIGIWNPAK